MAVSRPDRAPQIQCVPPSEDVESDRQGRNGDRGMVQHQRRTMPAERPAQTWILHTVDPPANVRTDEPPRRWPPGSTRFERWAVKGVVHLGSVRAFPRSSSLPQHADSTSATQGCRMRDTSRETGPCPVQVSSSTPDPGCCSTTSDRALCAAVEFRGAEHNGDLGAFSAQAAPSVGGRRGRSTWVIMPSRHPCADPRAASPTTSSRRGRRPDRRQPRRLTAGQHVGTTRTNSTAERRAQLPRLAGQLCAGQSSYRAATRSNADMCLPMCLYRAVRAARRTARSARRRPGSSRRPAR
jgi:hypothetical protein